jgi:small-conductance mechanosensitive channel
VPHQHGEASSTGDGREHRAIGVVAGIVAIAALVAGSIFGNVHGPTVNEKLIAWISAAVVLVAGVFAVTRIAWAVSSLVARRASSPAAAGPVRVLTAIVGYVFVALAVLASLEASLSHLLVGAGIAGIVLGIAAQQSLGNVFAGLVLLMARPFGVGDRIRIRSGALGGVFDASVRDLSLTYVTLSTDDGILKVPNSAMLAAGVGQAPPRPLDPGAPEAFTPE